VSFAHLALTLLQQSHLCPLPLSAQPVHWAYDQALQLYPLPHALVLADGSAGQEEFRHEGCSVFNPGCLHEHLFGVYAPFEDGFEPSALPGAAEDEEGGAAAAAEAARRQEVAEEAEATALVAEVLADAAAGGGDEEMAEAAGVEADAVEALAAVEEGARGPCAAHGSGSEDEEDAEAAADGAGGGGGDDDGDDVLPSWLLEQAGARTQEEQEG
jgi:hypothetical protein